MIAVIREKKGKKKRNKREIAEAEAKALLQRRRGSETEQRIRTQKTVDEEGQRSESGT